MLAGLTGAIVSALLIVWLLRSSGGVTYYTPNGSSSSAPASRPAKPVVEDVRPETQPAPEPEPKPVALPPYIELVESVAATTPKIEATLPAPNVIELTTGGVRRLRLLRAEWPQRVTSSIAVRIDGQGIEWTSRRDVLELERRDDGDWAIVKPGASAPVAERP